MRDAASAIRSLVDRRSVDEIEGDAMRRAAVPWHFIVLGEAAGQVPAKIRALHSTIAWTAATRLRNHIVHGYWSIDFAVLIDTASEDLPGTLAGLGAALGRS